MKFAPQSDIDEFQLFVDVNLFTRKLNVKKFFAEKANNTQTGTRNNMRNEDEENMQSQMDERIKHTGMKNRSTFNPQMLGNNHINSFKSLVIQDVRKLKKKESKKKKYKELRIEKGLKSLQKNKNIVIKPADKGGGIVVMNKSDYEAEMEKLLGDAETYTKLTKNPSLEFKKLLETLIEEGRKLGILNEEEAMYIIPKAPRLPTIYHLPKIHKNRDHPPGRPIVSGVDSLTSRLGSYLDFFLQPFVINLDSYIKDSAHIISTLQGMKVTTNTILATADVTSLYTMIPHEKGLEALEFFLQKSTDVGETQARFLLKCFDFALSHNFFWYGGEFFLQCKGVAMGARYAPSLANLYVGLWEIETIYQNRNPNLLLWRRFIDDVIILWEGDQASLDEYIITINNNNRNLTFTVETDQNSVNFLDLVIFKQNDILATKTYFKPTDRNGYVPSDSCHNPPWLKSIPRSQLARIRRNCSTLEDFYDQSSLIKKRLVDKGFEAEEVDKEVERMAGVKREDLLQPKEGKQGTRNKEEGSLLLVTNYNAQAGLIKKILRKHWDVLHLDPTLRSFLPQEPRIVFRRAQNLRDQLTRSYINPPKKKKGTIDDSKGFHQCGKCMGCRTSEHKKKKRTQFCSNITGKEYEVKSFITCQSKGVVYLIQCPCGLQYIGRTVRTLAVRIREHVYNIKKGIVTHNLSAHYKAVHNSNPSSISFMGIEQVTEDWRGTNLVREISKRETYWIYDMDTLSPKGLNIEIDINCFLDSS